MKHVPTAGAALMSCVATLAQMLIIVAGVESIWFKLLIIPSLVGIAILVVAGVLVAQNT